MLDLPEVDGEIMDWDDKQQIAMFGFKRSRKKRRKAAIAVLMLSLTAIMFAVWFVVLKH